MIEFYSKETGEAVDNSYDMYFVRGDGSVWRDNGETWESQCSVIGFEDCCEACPELAWRVVPNVELSGPRPLAAEGSDSNDVLEG